MHFELTPASRPSAAVWISLHGAGRTAADLPPMISGFTSGDAIVALRGPIVHDQGYTFIEKRPDGAIVRKGLAAVARQLESFLEDLAVGTQPPHNLYLCGYSSGATMAAALVLRGRAAFNGVVLFRPFPPYGPRYGSPCPGLPVLLIDGADDSRRTPADALMLAAQLASMGAVVTHRTVMAGHGPVPEDIEVARAWRESLRPPLVVHHTSQKLHRSVNASSPSI